MSFKPWDFFRKKLQGAPDEVAAMTVGRGQVRRTVMRLQLQLKLKKTQGIPSL